jgi:hypothetical protein
MAFLKERHCYFVGLPVTLAKQAGVLARPGRDDNDE